jgi:hypothetical protein
VNDAINGSDGLLREMSGCSLYGVKHSGIAAIMRGEPTKHSCVELLTSSIHGTAMTSKRYLPQNYVSRIVGANPFGLLERNVAIWTGTGLRKGIPFGSQAHQSQPRFLWLQGSISVMAIFRQLWPDMPPNERDSPSSQASVKIGLTANLMTGDSGTRISADGIFITCFQDQTRLWEVHPDDITSIGAYSRIPRTEGSVK